MEIIPMGNTTVQYEGVLDDQKFYNFLRDLLVSAGYSVKETNYIQFSGANYVIKWVAMKVIDDYMAYRITVNLDYRNIQETMAVKDGKQVKAKTGTVQVQLVSDILVDYLNKWTKGVSKLVRPIYDKMNEEVVEQRKAAFESDVESIKSAIQSNFNQ
ncbi:MAG: hypothetical protein QXD02_01235 [Candidatus Parvarchaeum sp.]|nr:hypothetical protein [Candidatus Parvarchaeota archaeon]MCW1294280.1 hypothetical protein [Candidatus Parvarchaeum tengchongense]MCW1295607.1 hypothetical protein [Candidatus Parvarchaeum tengchongense]MCW1298929.1 hypothetical protein [Candidatus Parvarchaeum tengchongense]